MNVILLALNNLLTVGGIFCDLEKAFDSINHDILLYKYEFYGFRDKTNALLWSYLIERYQGVVVNNCFLTMPLFQNNASGSWRFNTWYFVFFLICINDLLNIIADPSKLILFADDISLIITNPSPSKFIEHINNISDTINEWHNFLGQFCKEG